jgi:hypothetical protein
MQKRNKTRTSTVDNWIIALVSVLAFCIAIAGHRYGLGQKWNAAVVGTAAPFGAVIMGYRRWWRRASFWLSFFLCFLVHCVVFIVILKYWLAGVTHMGILTLAPIAFGEAFVLLVAVFKVDHLLTGKNDSIRIS